MTEALELPERESMEFDVVIVGAGPAGLSAAIRLPSAIPTETPPRATRSIEQTSPWASDSRPSERVTTASSISRRYAP